MRKKKLNINVMDAAVSRIEWLFESFDNICLSFSGGKDSTVLFHLMSTIAKAKGRKFNVLFIDWEAQYTITISHIEEMKKIYKDVIKEFFWVALPLKTVNGVSQTQPEWIAWEKNQEWVRKPPEDAITDFDFFPFYRYAMTFEDFVVEFNEWLSGKDCLASVIGIRTDESLNRYRGLSSRSKIRFSDDKPWTTASLTGFSYTCYPLYDWKSRDIWIFNAKTKLPYNHIYDLMYGAGVPVNNMRVCEPFGPEQRKGLWLYHVIEPDTWAKICYRVHGANCGSIYANQSGDFYALNTKMKKPLNHTWRSYALFLLNSMPHNTAEHYRNKIAIYLQWYRTRGFPDDIPDEQENDLGSRDIPSWRRICKTIIKNDFWCRMLSFSPTKSHNYVRYMEKAKTKRKEWGGI